MSRGDLLILGPREGRDAMRVARTIVALIVLPISSPLGRPEVFAQGLPEPPRKNSTILSDQWAEGERGPQSNPPYPASEQSGGPPVRPSRQADDFRRTGGN